MVSQVITSVPRHLFKQRMVGLEVINQYMIFSRIAVLGEITQINNCWWNFIFYLPCF